MKQISGIITEIIIANEDEVLCKVLINESLSPYFLVKNLHANITSLNNDNNISNVSLQINNYLNKEFTGKFMRKLTHNKIELVID